MAGSIIRVRLIVWGFDLLLALAVFWLCMYAGGLFPRWYWMAASAFVWVLCGIFSRKLYFDLFKRTKDAFSVIVFTDIAVYGLLFVSWKQCFPEREITSGRMFLPLVLIFCEFLMYIAFRFFVSRQRPYLYEEAPVGSEAEPELDGGIGIDLTGICNSYPDFQAIHEQVERMDWRHVRQWIESNPGCFSSDTFFSGSVNSTCDFPEGLRMIVCLAPFNDSRHLNGFLLRANSALSGGGVIMIHGQTSGMRRERIKRNNPKGLGAVLYIFDYFLHRVLPKMGLTRRLYMSVTGGHNRSFPRVEILGRLSRAGFTILEDAIFNGEYYVFAGRSSEPLSREKPYCGMFVRLRRIGYDGKIIGVYKFRTMYAYSEYLQDYVYRRSGLDDGGKFKNDFRINFLGRFLRSTWLDELPMLVNLFKGDVKLVGVRPLSEQYYSLYTPQMQALRIKVKPGLLPPFYYDKVKPVTIEDIQLSEKKYIESYIDSPFATDWKYFWGIVFNILARRERSK